MKSLYYDKDRILQYKRGFESWFNYQLPYRTILVDNTVKTLSEYPDEVRKAIPEYVEFYTVEDNPGKHNHCEGVIYSLKSILSQIPEIIHSYKYIIYNEPRHVIFQPNLIYSHLKHRKNTFCRYNLNDKNEFAYYFGHFIMETSLMVKWLYKHSYSPVEISMHDFCAEHRIPVHEIESPQIGIARYFMRNRAEDMGHKMSLNGDSTLRKMSSIDNNE